MTPQQTHSLSPEAILKDPSRFTQTSSPPLGKTKLGLIAAKPSSPEPTHTVALNLDDPEVKGAARTLLLREPGLAAAAVAEYPDLKEYLEKDLGIASSGVASVVTARPFVVPEEDVIAVDEDDDDGVLDSQLRLAATSMKAQGGGKFSMLVAVTQAALNSQLFFRWADPERPELQTMVVEAVLADAAPGARVDADMAAPQVSLKVVNEAGQNSGSVFFHLNFLGGVCRVWDTETQTLVEAEDIFGWRMVVEVDLKLVDLDVEGEEYRRVAEQYQIPGTFGISALAAEFDTARVTAETWAQSTFGSFSMSPSRRESFAALVLRHLHALSLSINYSLVDRTGTIPNPTMPPTQLILQTYPYRHSTAQSSGSILSAPVEGLSAAGDKNMLLYLGMTRNQGLPASQHLPFSANWVASMSPAAGNPVAGCLAINRADFLDGFLIPKLTAINRATYFEVTKAHTKKTGPAKAEYSFSIGRAEQPDSFFAWRKMAVGQLTVYAWTTSSSKSDEDGLAGFESRASGKAGVSNVLQLHEGTNRISWGTSASLRLETSLKAFGINSKGVATASRTGTTSINLNSVLDGKLSAAIAMPAGWVTTTSDGSNSFGFSGTNMDHFADELEHRYFDESVITTSVNNINDKLQKGSAFVLPGGGNFLMKNPVFNGEFDLLVELTYNGSQ
ncbi:hypothetical protein B0T16DRAFT_457106 [Cercophora newfieldiana]|uniref:Uncharacterized protein n=1 Tax=Cercophora newfieldiana TaxID=92897 RepID=A0AA39YD69_9PEZI|nr:hypothetical protein B0T16DRAFT_457106 [Cercophora newfieldiana]